jgi:hypothetical protein
MIAPIGDISMSDTKETLSVVVRSDDKGHWVEWNNDGETGSLGPYQTEKMSGDVRTAKERELTENSGHIDDA